MKSILLSVSLALALTACGTTSSTKLDVTVVDASKLPLLDERPPEQRLASQSTSSIGTLTRLGDDSVSPQPVALVRTWLYRGLPDALATRRVALTRFAIEIYDPAVTVDHQRLGTAAAGVPGANAASAGLAGGLITGIESIHSTKTVGAKIELRIDDKVVAARGGGSFQGRVTEADINAVITDALDDLVRKLRAAQ
jgi:hypothetical protein